MKALILNTLQISLRSRAIPENVQFHVSVDGYPVRCRYMHGTRSLSFISESMVCTGVCFMRCFAEFERRTTESRPHKVLGRDVDYISEGTTKEGHAVGRQKGREP